ncbi:conserved hypothetical protein [Ricinus communis]|uniref:Uncharacterized protein n=1 Tax=Ricinus communis TaxID=3988 RepID=B9T9D2_RICCO|nr:conserved hypothetical protein [Ricinus communis]
MAGAVAIACVAYGVVTPLWSLVAGTRCRSTTSKRQSKSKPRQAVRHMTAHVAADSVKQLR